MAMQLGGLAASLRGGEVGFQKMESQCICKYVYMYIRIYVYMYICMYVNIQVYM